MTTAQAASRLDSDQSPVLKFINHGLRFPTRNGRARLRLKATRTGHAWSVTAEAVREFAAKRREYGL
jgi:hypothetical protein